VSNSNNGALPASAAAYITGMCRFSAFTKHFHHQVLEFKKVWQIAITKRQVLCRQEERRKEQKHNLSIDPSSLENRKNKTEQTGVCKKSFNQVSFNGIVLEANC
jgi:hypothetical protein